MPCLVADIGGTNSRFAIAGDRPGDIGVPIFLKNDEFNCFEDVFGAALEQLETPISASVIAVAGPLFGREATLTNRGWDIRPTALSKIAAGVPVHLINDFSAQARALPYLNATALDTIAHGRDDAEGHKLVLGPGTGLGVGFLINTPEGWMATSGEGGHVSRHCQTNLTSHWLMPNFYE
jgi:glucokinase